MSSVSTPSNLPSRRAAYGLLALSIAIGGVSFTLVKVALEELSPLGLATGRVVVSAVVFSWVVLRAPWRRTPIEPQDRLRLVLCGFGGSAVFHLLFNWGQQYTSVAVSAVLMATFPVLVAAGEVVFLRHRLRQGQVVGLLLTTIGCLAIGVAGGGDGHSTRAGMIAVGLASLVWAAVTVATRSITDRYDAWWLNTPGTVLGALFILCVDLPHLHEFTALSPKGWLAVIWLGSASSAFIYFVMARVMTVVSATTTASLGTVVTPASVLVAWLVLGNAPTLVEVVGGIVVVGGAVMVTRHPTAEADDVVDLATTASAG
jgi:DME family drug/metabolite transporter